MLQLKELRQELHQIPELGFQEFKTQQFILTYLQELSCEFLTITKWRTGVVAFFKGVSASKTIGWRTDIDGLPVMEETNVTFSSTHTGYMHACGHDCHMTVALGLAQKFAQQQPKQNIVIYFQPAEEAPGGAEPMMQWLKTERPDLLCDEIYALHVAPEYPVGTVATKPGLLFANTSELFIDLQGVGGHAAFPHKTKDMAIAAAQLLLQLQTIVSRNVDPLNSVVITVGKLEAGTVQNVIAERARLEGTIRTLNVESMVEVKRRIEAICQGIEIGFECSIQIDYGSMYYEVNNDARCANQLLAFAEQVEGVVPVVSNEAMTGEDFGYFLKEIPGAMFWAGANCAYGLHHSKMLPDDALLEKNVDFVERYFRSL